MGAIDAIGAEATRTVFDVLVCMVWADRKITDDELAAARAAALALGLPSASTTLDEVVRGGAHTLEMLPLESLSRRDGDLTYLCAAWMALADREEAAAERQLLVDLRRRLAIDETRASWLRARARTLREVTPPTVSFWREFDQLVVSAAKALARGEDPS
jgi:hypothetical protein